MAIMIKYKVKEVATDLDVTTKEVVAVLKEQLGVDKKAMTALTEEELNFIFDYFTQKNAVDDLSAYFAVRDNAIKKQEEEAAKRKEEEKKRREEAKNQLRPESAKKAASAQQTQPKKEKVDKTAEIDLKSEIKSKRGTGRIVDTGAAEVNVDRYNQRYDDMALDKVRNENNMSSKKQKINQRSKQKNRRSAKRETERERMARIEKERKAKKMTVLIPDEISIGDLALRLKATVAEVVKKAFLMGTMVTANDVVDFDTASLIAMEFHAKVEKEVVVTIEERIIDDSEDSDENLVDRAPVVVVMGHVDHGKTSLLDYIRNAHVTATEAGGITQHIGAYRVNINDRDITFLDTPGHEAFTTMRARGAQVTDIAILVVAADDGIMPQTVESINHAKAANIPVVVAINKMDTVGANPERIKQQLTEYDLVSEEWGGDTIICPISAKTGMGIDNLLENLVVLAEVQELKANPNRAARGAVIEARLDKGRGPIMTVLVQNGTLHLGDIIIAGSSVGRVRTMINDKGQRVTEAGPSTPVEISGMDSVPSAGDTFNAVGDERMARELAEERRISSANNALAGTKKVSLDDLFSQIQAGEMKTLNIIVKADVQGSAEAVKASLEKISNEEVRVKVIHSGVGAINESDVMLAATSGAIIVGFNVRPDNAARDSAARSKVDMRMYRVIYDCINEIEAAMKGMLAPKFKEVVIGHAEVRETYKVSKIGTVCGCYCTDGKIQRGCDVRVLRDNIVIHEGQLASLRRFKDDVKEVASGYECGMQVEKFNDIKVGDVIECFVMEQIV